MKKLLVALAILLSGNVAHAAVVFISTSNSGYVASDDSASFNHTITSGDNRYLLVGVLIPANLGVGSVTYNGDAMALIHTSGTLFRSEIWGLANPDIGVDQAVVVTLDSANNSAAVAISFTGVGSTESGNGSANVAPGTSFSTTATTETDNAWVVDFTLVGDLTVTVGAGQTQRANFDDGGIYTFLSSTEGPQTPAGDVVMSWGTVDALDPYVQSVIALAPAAAHNGIEPDGGIHSTGVKFQ